MTVLLTTIHDPGGRLLDIKRIESLVKHATSNYDSCMANITKATHPDVRKLARKHFDCIESTGGTQGEHMISLMKKAAGKSFHYCDFDRLIHWQARYPEELAKISKKLDVSMGFTFICRTRRAFGTHPEVQRDTELPSNLMISGYLGMKVDMGSGAFGFNNATRKAFASIKGDVRGVRFLGHFLVQIKNRKIPVSKIYAEGVEWETPDVHTKEIRKMGYKKWLSKFQSHDEWRRRVDYINQVAEVLYGKK